MPRHATSTTFKKGFKRSQESIEKQRQTMLNQFSNGSRLPPKPIWTDASKKQMVEANRKTKLKNTPIGSRRLHNTGGPIYWVVKVSDKGKWKYEHRIIMQKHLGKLLDKRQLVHHINKDTLDNRIENLEIVTHTNYNLIHNLGKHHKKGYKLPVRTQEYKEKLSKALKGRIFTEVHKQHLRDSKNKLKSSIRNINL